MRIIIEINSVTYDELVDLITHRKLIPGSKYRIEDYRTTHYMLDGDSDILVNNYTCEVIKTSTGTFKLKYLDGTDNTKKNS